MTSHLYSIKFLDWCKPNKKNNHFPNIGAMSHVGEGPSIKARANSLVSQVFLAQLDIVQSFLPLSGWMAGRDDGERFFVAAATGLFSHHELRLLSPLVQGKWYTEPDNSTIFLRPLSAHEHNFLGLENPKPDNHLTTPEAHNGPRLIKVELVCPGSAICAYVVGLTTSWPEPKLQAAKDKFNLSLKAMGLIAAMYTELSVASERVIEMQRDAHVDSLTAVLNRAGWNHRLDQIQIHSINSSTDSAIIMLDLDFLKEVNDKHGHKAGDDLLHLTAQTVLSVLRGSDAVARLGGDEFGIVIKDANLDSINALIARLKQAFAKVQINISMGGALASESNGQVLGAVQLADARMYAHKRGKLSNVAHPIDWLMGGAASCVAEV